MTAVKSPGAVAARGAWKIDLLGSKVDSEDSLRSLTAQPLRLRAGIQKISTSLRLSHASTSPPCSRGVVHWRQFKT
jgi:hypothetical protein